MEYHIIIKNKVLFFKIAEYINFLVDTVIFITEKQILLSSICLFVDVIDFISLILHLDYVVRLTP